MQGRKIFFVSIIVAFLGLMVLFYAFKNQYSPFIVTQADDFYSYISIDNPSDEPFLQMVVPFGVFSVDKENQWVHVARMDVTIVECDLVDGVRDEGTLYTDKVEYWMLNTSEESTFGPMNEFEYQTFTAENQLSNNVPDIPDSYKYYINDLNRTCGNIN